MSPLLKAGSGQTVRRFVAASVPETLPGFAPAAEDPRELELARLAAELECLEAARRQDAAEATRRIDAARQEGRAQGLAAAQAQEEARLAALRDGIEAASTAFAARLKILDELAPALVRGALAKLFDSFEEWSGPAEAAVARQLRTLGDAAVVHIRVSARDFPDPEVLAAMSERLGIVRTKLIVDADLRAGASRIECRLGQVEVDVRDQWQTLSSLFEAMAQ
ncbi:hypothetical protein [Sphingomonas elodea]|uniref:hypothetical protein n=1 Tax=Sphingomonas elodea TaxID=179878 RepID=UPI0002631381|nr:hypothetical protein [Sphingomonas elodea]